MLTERENAELTRVGAGTRMGELLRRYWHPIGAASEMDERWTKRVRLLGEDLVLYKDRQGRFGLIGEQCPHRRASLAYGIPTNEGIRCPYHGWMFDGTGRCLEQPNEPEGSTFKDKVSLPGYPVRVAAGMLFVYLGPLPAPQLTLLDGYVVDPAIRMVGSCIIPCNWLQIMENSVDPIHSEWLHGHLQEFVEAERGTPSKMPATGHHLKIAFDDAPFGIVKRRLKEGQSEDSDDWRVGHPLVFPNILAVGNASWQMYEFQVRVPVDDEHTLHVWFTSFAVPPGIDVPAELLGSVHAYDIPAGGPDEGWELDLVDHQDIMAWVTQGPVCDRRLEHLGATDRGVTMYRRMLQREYEKIEAGGDPINVFRGTGTGTGDGVVLDLPLEKGKAHYNDTFERYVQRKNWRYSGIVPELVDFFRKRDALAGAAHR